MRYPVVYKDNSLLHIQRKKGRVKKNKNEDVTHIIRMFHRSSLGLSVEMKHTKIIKCHNLKQNGAETKLS